MVSALRMIALVLVPIPSLAAAPLTFRHVGLDLPGAPVDVISADLNSDGRQDLLVIVARTLWGQIGTDRIEGLVQISEVVPALFDRREAHAFLQGPDGVYRRAGEALSLAPSILSLEAGPRSLPVVVLTDDGVSVLRVTGEGADAQITLQPIIVDRPVLGGSRMLIPHLGLVQDVDRDGTLDLALPSRDGLAIFRGTTGGFSKAPVSRLTLPGDERRSGAQATRRFPIPRVEDVNGDRIPDLVLVDPRDGEPSVFVLRGQGEGRFSAPKRVDLSPSRDVAPSIPKLKKSKESDEGVIGDDDDDGFVSFGDLDGDGLAEAVSKTTIDTGKGDFKQAKEPHFRYHFHHVSRDLTVEAHPYYQTEVVGHGFDIELGDTRVAEFQDLDGDGRKDLVTVSLDFSLFQIIRVMATKRIGIGLDFHLWHQERDGSFLAVPKLDLSETLRMDLNDLKLERLAEFAGDFDGDGRSDFIHLGRGKSVTIHKGQAGCRYPSSADMTIPLEDELQDLGLVRVDDFDGDGRSDLAITKPLEGDDPGASAPTRLDIYLSGGPR